MFPSLSMRNFGKHPFSDMASSGSSPEKISTEAQGGNESRNSDLSKDFAKKMREAIETTIKDEPNKRKLSDFRNLLNDPNYLRDTARTVVDVSSLADTARSTALRARACLNTLDDILAYDGELGKILYDTLTIPQTDFGAAVLNTISGGDEKAFNVMIDRAMKVKSTNVPSGLNDMIRMTDLWKPFEQGYEEPNVFDSERSMLPQMIAQLHQTISNIKLRGDTQTSSEEKQDAEENPLIGQWQSFARDRLKTPLTGEQRELYYSLANDTEMTTWRVLLFRTIDTGADPVFCDELESLWTTLEEMGVARTKRPTVVERLEEALRSNDDTAMEAISTSALKTAGDSLKHLYPSDLRATASKLQLLADQLEEVREKAKNVKLRL
ncbi:uncharacterized protein I206_106622 [Kwoniella pini CBS 10737]|uniref:Uncharacterized protein n=1 Tax=Kwoniella pini CBS 10737 TaxID=1296096 RepID=A0A1B9HTN9_9TREE|nr:uncharacterized protein I206_07487 [Kwoniella pini CBS 10737]OCF46634.1 hypothetical protein I206_07487 [Kwoniella pini CBS 10737]